MDNLSSLPNIGKSLAEKLKMVGIEDKESFYNVGSQNAFLRIKSLDSEACINMLYALEGAIQGIRWHGLSEETKLKLKEFYRMLDKQ